MPNFIHEAEMEPSGIQSQNQIGYWIKEGVEPEFGNQHLKSAVARIDRPLYLLDVEGRFAVAQNGTALIGDSLQNDADGHSILAYTPPLLPQNLGDASLKRFLKIRYPYIIGAMANAITSVEMVAKAGRAGMLGFFGAAGLALAEIEAAIDRLYRELGNSPFGVNLIHSPQDPALESATVDLYLRRGVNLVSASAYLDLTLPLVYFRIKGIQQTPGGTIVCPNRVLAKASRIEVARKFFSPPPEKLIKRLLDQNLITENEASLAKFIPMADALTAEADSGGHTDNRPAISLLPTMIALRDEITANFRYNSPPKVGLGGGISTPYSTAAAFAMGAAFVLAGSIHQACIESGTSQTVREMLAQTQQADVAMAPAADMFEMGVKVQVLKRGTLFPFRAARLYELYSRYESLEDIPAEERAVLERDFFRCRFDEEWEKTRSFFMVRDPKQIERVEGDPKHKMALLFRSYLGRSSIWANTDETTRKIDYQIWCGPSMGAFNEWVKGSFLEEPQNRETITVALNLLFGACVSMRAQWLNWHGVPLAPEVGRFSPMHLSSINEIIHGTSLT